MPGKHLHLLGTEDATGKWAGHEGARMEMLLEVRHQGGSRCETKVAAEDKLHLHCEKL